jgi:hypothetical protein
MSLRNQAAMKRYISSKANICRAIDSFAIVLSICLSLPCHAQPGNLPTHSQPPSLLHTPTDSITHAPAVKRVKVPDLRDLHIDDAKVMLKEARLLLGEIARRSSPNETDTVIDQRPTPGTTVLSGTPVHLLLSNKVASSENPPGQIEYSITLKVGGKRFRINEPVVFTASIKPPADNVYYHFMTGEDNKEIQSDGNSITHTYTDSGDYYPYVFASVSDQPIIQSEQEHIIVEALPEKPPVRGPIKPPDAPASGENDAPPWQLLIIAAAIIAGAGYFLLRTKKNNKEIRDKSPKVHVNPYRDPGVRQLFPDVSIRKEFKCNLTAVMDKGAQKTEWKGEFIIDEKEDK